MDGLNDAQKIQYLQRSYAAVDGLWFMKVEEADGFDRALAADNEVWKVMPKIQARFLKSALGQGDGLAALRQCFTEKLLIDGFVFQAEGGQGRDLRITVSTCPWHDLMVKSGREHLAPRVCEMICQAEYAGWAREFGGAITFEIEHQRCRAGEDCVLCFRQT